ncbi:GNAT family N-acetyltransferase [Neiella marina]|uniref:GNAT family N-acetyltransferase n=1 Tax=Neiella holothuriorum TaxID=2870530 RepID=A0ABS7EKL7_9GAMM|nr:arsinothricin resistance N-acetyltransferase ArsN1 family B [Neiella holothuriorum]MBW8192894.1 GNAT family N-acetyltransferase [Neiella holothuriorum]
MIRDALLSDASAMVNIYNHYVSNTAITFEETRVSDAEFKSRISKVQQAGLPWLLATGDQGVLGYAYATPWKERSAYRYSVESTVYLAEQAQGRGLGTALYQALLERLGRLDINSVIGGITLPNPASVALHEKVGMKKVAHFEQVGFKFNTWLDVGYWQLNLSPE